VQLTFCGAAREVTGSCFHFETGASQFLVDCGMFQGARMTRALNLDPFRFDPRRIDFVVLTHAHIDHSGLLPRLCAEGFRGPIYTTAATRDLIAVLLPDSAHLQKVEEERALRYGRDYTAAYTIEQANAVPGQVRTVDYETPFEPARGVRVRLRDAGHILGSAFAELWLSEAGHTRKVVVSGDLGQPGRPIVRDPAVIAEADVLLLESTYGNRNHKPLKETLDELVGILNSALLERRGMVIVPAFALGRTQEFLYYLNQLSRQGLVRDLEVFVDSPMATEITHITARHLELFDAEATRLANEAHPPRSLPRVHYTQSVEESMALNRLSGGAIIVAASGMCDGGRVRHHLKHHLPNPRTTVVMIGFQAAGTLGRRLVDGAETVRILGDEVPVRARVATLGGFSAHADQSALLAWLGHLSKPPRRLFLVHGEEDVAAEFATRIEDTLRWKAHVPQLGETVAL
jgi:metallo-beta-lactamase family protein